MRRLATCRPRQLINGILVCIMSLMLSHMAVVWLRSVPGPGGGDSAVVADSMVHNSRGIQSIEDFRDLQRGMPEPLNLGRSGGRDRDEPLLLTRAPPITHAKTLPALLSLPTLGEHVNKSALAEAMRVLNSAQNVRNAGRYNRTDWVVVVQVHDRADYLRLLVRSFARAKDIHRCLLVFSHDVYDIEINRLVHSIGFAKTLQIFFPYSQQLYSNRFPGAHPNDCPRNMNKHTALRVGCGNAKWPDKYGHYREPKYCQTKHHWLWKNHFVFENIRSLRNFTGLYLFLEDDHYVSEDFLHTLNLMDRTAQRSFPSVDIYCLGTYEKKPVYGTHTGKFQIGKWVSSFHNMGMAFKRSLWKRIKSCAKQFCEFDDYNWDWSMMYLSLTCGGAAPYQVMLLKNSPRVFHIGECGVHHKGKTCSPTRRVSQIDIMLDQHLRFLYPQTLSHIGPVTIRARVPRPNGGWGDLRDRLLCKSFVFGEKEDFPVKPRL